MNRIEKARAAGGAAERAEDKAAGSASIFNEDTTTKVTESQDDFAEQVMSCEHPIPVNRDIAAAIGMDEAAFLQEVHYWLTVNRKAGNNYRDGRYWTYNSYEQWADLLKVFNVMKIRRIVSKLVKMGILITGRYNKLNTDRTKWYSIDYSRVKEVVESNSRTVQNEQYGEVFKMNRPIPSHTVIPSHNEIKNKSNGANDAFLAEVRQGRNENSEKELHRPKLQKKRPKSSRTNMSKLMKDTLSTYPQPAVNCALDYVAYYVETLYPKVMGREHPDIEKYEYIKFARKILDCAGELDGFVTLKTICDMLSDALESDRIRAIVKETNDGAICFYTTPEQLSFWLVHFDIMDVPSLRGTSYDYEQLVQKGNTDFDVDELYEQQFALEA